MLEKNSCRKSVSKKIGLLLIVVVHLFSFNVLAEVKSKSPSTNTTPNWKQIYHQLYVWNSIKVGKKKLAEGEFKSQTELNSWLNRTEYYSPFSLDETYNKIVGQKTSFKMSQERENVFSSNLLSFQNRKNIFEIIPNSFWRNPALRDLLTQINQEASSPTINQNQGYFYTPVGRRIQNLLKDYVMVIIPGFGSHTMKEYSFPEIVEEANSFYGRKLLRPSKKVAGRDDKLEYQPIEEYYKLRPGQTLGFDVVHPMGYEMGNTMGKTVVVADHLADWIRKLPKEYANKKLILVGYSKGAPTALHLISQYPELRERVKLIVSLAGAVQGAIPAESGLKFLKGIAENEDNELKREIKDLSGLLDGSVLNNPQFLSLLSMFGFDWKKSISNLQLLTESDDLKLAIGGAEDLTPKKSIEWNLHNLNSSSLGTDVSVFNISLITNRLDYVLPGYITASGPSEIPTVSPQIDPYTGMINWNKFSQDNLFLYLTSISGFKEAPGGLFDTQVAWLDTKSLMLDKRPLNQSLNQDQIDDLYYSLKSQNSTHVNWHKFSSSYEMGRIPRNQIVRDIKEGKVKFIDLGDHRGTHWDFAFRQVFKPEKQSKYYIHDFPRKAFLTALVETLAIYEISKEGVNP